MKRAPFVHAMSVFPMIPGSTRKVLEEEFRQLAGRADGASGSGRTSFTLRDYVPDDLGEGWWDFLKISPELLVYTVNTSYRQRVWIDNPADRWFKIRIVLSGRLEDSRGAVLQEGPGAHLEVFPGDISGGFFISGVQPLRMVGLVCQPELLTGALGLDRTTIPAPLNRLLTRTPGAPERATFHLGPDVLNAANDILWAQTEMSERLQRAYIESKGLEIVCLMINQLSRSPSASVSREAFKLSLRDLNRLYEAREILAEQFRAPPTIAELAKQVGINQTKLKCGFKRVFGCGVYELIKKVRMEHAAALLVSTPMTISEIAYHVGYDYPSNFTGAFKKFFGRMPRDVRRPAVERAIIDVRYEKRSKTLARLELFQNGNDLL